MLFVSFLWGFDVQWTEPQITRASEKLYLIELSGQGPVGAIVDIPMDAIVSQDGEIERPTGSVFRVKPPWRIGKKGRIYFRMWVPRMNFPLLVVVSQGEEKRNFQFNIDVESAYNQQESLRQKLARLKKERMARKQLLQAKELERNKKLAEKLKSENEKSSQEIEELERSLKEQEAATEDLSRPQHKYYAELGMGANIQLYNQISEEIELNLNYQTSSNSIYLGGGAEIIDNLEVRGGLSIVPGEIASSDTITLEDGAYSWIITSVDLLWFMNQEPWDLLYPAYGGLILGLQSHDIPIAERQAANLLKMSSARYTSASFGFHFDFLIAKDWVGKMHMRYQVPVSSDDQFQLTPQVAFDGSIGADRKMGDEWLLGVRWHGQQLNYGYETDDALLDTTIEGTHRLFFTSLELRLKWVFQ